ncbi:MAG: hypothetical protein M3154_07065 [Candidatus Eremiobacteraeota bacterium]|nr:hypothetical protein [Candidatus Eremiobacteraeota bacterium]
MNDRYYSGDGTSPQASTPVSPRRALFALGVAAIGTVAFVIGLRAALRRLPPEHPARPALVDSTRVDSTRVDSTRVDSTRVDSTRVDSTRARRLTPPAPNQPDEYPRLR